MKTAIPVTLMRRTPLHDWHAHRGARFAHSDDWQIPTRYRDGESELTAVRTTVAIGDVSAFPKIGLLGRGIDNLSRALLGGNPATRPLGLATLGDSGPVLVCRLTEGHLLLLACTTNAAVLSARLARLTDTAMTQADVTSAYAAFVVVGPNADKLLQRLTLLDVSLSGLPVASCAETSLAGVHAVVARPETDSISWLLVLVSWDLGEYVWEELFRAGKELQISPLGWDALRRLRLVTLEVLE
jgi:heterotetrameric sarcosine oxidase gamma subunit